MINKKFQENSFLKMAALSALLFFVVVLIIEAVFGLFKGQQISEALSKYSNTPAKNQEHPAIRSRE